jgi:hypothetical protein
MSLKAADAAIGVAKETANVWTGMNNFTHAFTGWGEHIEPFKPANKTQEVSMNITGDVAMFGALLTGRAQVGGVAIAEGESTAIGAAEGANTATEASQVQSTAEMAENLSNQIGKNSVPYRTPNAVGHIDLKGKAHFDKPSGGRIPTPHVQERQLYQQPGGGRINVGPQTTRPATKQDIRTARKLVERRQT